MSIHGYSYWTRREPLVPREQMWANEEAKSIDERRRRYRCRDRFVTLENIPSWPIYRQGIAQRLRQERREKIEAARRWIAQQREAYRRRCAQHEAKRQRLEAARERKAARQARRQAKLEQKQQQQKQVEQEAEANKKNVEQEEEDEASKQQVEQAKVEDEKNVEQEGGEVVEKKAEEEPVEEEEKKEDSDDDGDEDDDDDVDDDDDEDDDEDVTSSDEESELSSSEEEPVFAELPDPDADEEVEEQAPPPTAHFAPDEEINRIVTMWRGDITHLEIDAIVNAANRSMLGGGGIDGAIHRAAGDDLYNECKQLNGCATGHCKITRGYWLPAKYVIHTVGPIGENPVALRSCYLNCLRVAVANGVRSLAFCGISTGIYGYPLYEASHIALKTVRRWLEEGDNRTKFDSIIFCVFLDKERLCYEQLIPLYFPLPGAPYELLPMQPGEEREVPPMVEGKDLSSYSDSDSDSDDDDDDDSDDEGEAEKGKGKKTAKGAAPVAPPPIPNADANANAANVDAAADADAANGDAEAEVSQLASGVEALAIAPSAAPAEDQTAAAAAPAANDANNDATSTTSTATSTGSDDASTDATPAQ